MRRMALVASSLLLLSGLQLAVAQSTDKQALTQQQQQAQTERERLRSRIDKLQVQIDKDEARKQQADQALKASETAISDIQRQLANLQTEQEKLAESLEKLAAQTDEQQGELQARRKALASQLVAQYRSNLSPWTALLSGNDPHVIGRNFGYLGYVSKAQAQAVTDVNESIRRLERLAQETKNKETELTALKKQTEEQHAVLRQEEKKRQKVLAEVQDALAEQRGQARSLHEKDKRLASLISDLHREIAEIERAAQAEAERQRAEQARQAKLKQQHEQRKIEEARRRAQEIRDQQASSQADTASEPASPQPSKTESSKSASPASPETTPSESPTGLSKTLPQPVPGDIQGSFGRENPDGDVWRGVVIRAAEGTQVKAVAAGRVVYADWLSGFGNLLIIDHGEQYLTVYAYNQSLLKEVGDVVTKGEAVALVGATGGQVESGLYFEIRHEGKPVNPVVWMGQ